MVLLSPKRLAINCSNRSLLSGHGFQLADKQFSTVINIHSGNGSEVVVNFGQLVDGGPLGAGLLLGKESHFDDSGAQNSQSCNTDTGRGQVSHGASAGAQSQSVSSVQRQGSAGEHAGGGLVEESRGGGESASQNSGSGESVHDVQF